MAKWLNKRTQAVTERLNKDTKRTEYETDFQELIDQTEATRAAIQRLFKDVPVFLHPNPAARAKAAMGTTYAKMRKTASERRYPHHTGELATVLTKSAEEFPPDSGFGQAMRHVGEALQKICEAHHEMDDDVMQHLLAPIKETQDGVLKDLAKERKKMESRRLDYDYKKRKIETGKSSFTNDDVKQAEEKFAASREIYENSMLNFLDNDSEQVGQLQAFVNAYLNVARQSVAALEEAQEALAETLSDVQSRPRREPRPQSTYNFDDDDDDDDYDDDDARDIPAGTGPCCIAAYDFEAEAEGELSFAEGQTIRLLSRLDENWLEGELNGRTGIFPSTYVEIVRDL
ncbi:uncharacterized protein MONBRDRAFT_36833 [Monosiga brevicollis MX1]|uniref:SH3 domain-containing protein n=1 Tax=Monosiga brevicollis TaxID=81824 RepID=A9UY21_MONBE|nr:uncharacterized protein MONBRDRAFT_36833 [Monosiga brevicollis MX1]EDQ89786.1 predicted protein [Monosiga brevicollis MX1]|eukprot:XP_001745208.1 hypothetical protein [Monosiga brevicollis MX1]